MRWKFRALTQEISFWMTHCLGKQSIQFPLENYHVQYVNLVNHLQVAMFHGYIEFPGHIWGCLR